MSERLNVFLRGRLVGSLDWDSQTNSMYYAYDSEYVARSDAVPISMSLPLQVERFNPYRSRVFFENLLPPEVVRKKLETVLHHDYRNVFAYLKLLGGDCAGAISLYPDVEVEKRSEEKTVELSEDEADEILRSLPERPLLQGVVEGYRISVSGAQDKLVARVCDGSIVLPLYGAASTHIIKPQIAMCRYSVHNENFCMRLAMKVGLTAAGCSILDVKDIPYYVTTRYDREVTDNGVIRLLQEDMCQAMGIPAESKYQEDGGPSAVRCFNFIRDRGLGFPELNRFIDYFLFNFLVGNADAHGKNYSILYRGDHRMLAPDYDVMSTAVYGNIVNRMAMSIGGARDFPEVNRESFEQFAAQCEISPKFLLSRLDSLAEQLPRVAASLAEELSDAGQPSPIYEEIIKVVNRHTAQVLP